MGIPKYFIPSKFSKLSCQRLEKSSMEFKREYLVPIKKKCNSQYFGYLLHFRTQQSVLHVY